MSEDPPLVRLEVADGVATVTLSSPGNRNALSAELLTQLGGHLATVEEDEAVRVVVLTGEGPVFSSGADLKDMLRRSPAAATARLADVIERLWHSPRPVVCRLNGPARAGGVGLLASCDVVVAAHDVTFSFTEVRIGVVPAIVAVPVLRRLPPAVACHLFLTGDVVDAARARDIGLVNLVSPPGDLDVAVDRVVDQLMRAAPGALAATKALTRTVLELSVADGLAAMAQLSARTFAGAEGREGLRAFVERREPSWVPENRRRNP